MPENSERAASGIKIFTQLTERNDLTLRTRIKQLTYKIICFSRSVELPVAIFDKK